ncbi:MAG: hypothetical protein QE269_06690 [Fimbriimonas sp.]|nr:hypothetical protein [Fimbriimonas sp.]
MPRNLPSRRLKPEYDSKPKPAKSLPQEGPSKACPTGKLLMEEGSGGTVSASLDG